MKSIIIAVLLFAVAVIDTCKKPHQRENYMPLVMELHKIECDELKKSGIQFMVNDTNIYTFRGIAFDKIMTRKPDAVLIAHYEDLNQKLAAMEFEMDEQEKTEYKENLRKEYLKPCE